MKYGETVKFADLSAGHLIYGGGVLWELVESGSVGRSNVPTAPVMVARWVHPEQKSYKVGSTSVDYFNADFMYVGEANDPAHVWASAIIFQRSFEKGEI